MTRILNESQIKKIRSHTKRAIRDIGLFNLWIQKIALTEAPVEGSDIETTNFMKMLTTGDSDILRLGSRAIYYQHLNDPELLGVAAKQLESIYHLPELDKNDQDAVAWLCKAIGQAGDPSHVDLLSRVAEESPHKKIRKYAKNYAR